MKRVKETQAMNDNHESDILDKLPPQDSLMDQMFKAFEDLTPITPDGVVGDLGATLPVEGTKLIH